MLGLRTCGPKGESYKKFKWDLTPGAIVEAPDWNPEPVCGGGLHFLPWGEGDASLLDWTQTAKALVVRPLTKIVDIDGTKSKARKCKVIAVFASIPEAAQYIAENGGQGRAIAGVTAIAGDEGTAMAGYRGTATAGHRGTAMAGNGGTAMAGNWGTAMAGNWGTATAGYRGTAMAGNRGTATAGDRGTATAGHGGTATAGNGGTAMAGNGGTAMAGNRGTATAGYGGTIICCWWDCNRRRYEIGYIDETLDVDGNILQPGQPYQLNNDRKFIKA